MGSLHIYNPSKLYIGHRSYSLICRQCAFARVGMMTAEYRAAGPCVGRTALGTVDIFCDLGMWMESNCAWSMAYVNVMHIQTS